MPTLNDGRMTKGLGPVKTRPLSREGLTFGAHVSQAEALEAGLIHGPRIPLRYGSAPTVIHVANRQWRTMHHAPGPWIDVDDYSHVDTLIGKRVRMRGSGREGVVKATQDEELLFEVLCRGDLYPIWSIDEIEVVPMMNAKGEPRYRNPFEQALFRHHLLETLGPQARKVWEDARRFRLDVKHDILMMPDGPARESLLKEFGWTVDDLQETCQYPHERSR